MSDQVVLRVNHADRHILSSAVTAMAARTTSINDAPPSRHRHDRHTVEPWIHDESFAAAAEGPLTPTQDGLRIRTGISRSVPSIACQFGPFPAGLWFGAVGLARGDRTAVPSRVRWNVAGGRGPTRLRAVG